LSLHDFYNTAKSTVVVNGYSDEITWCSNLDTKTVTTQDVFREAAWVIVNSGFREQIARRLFPNLSLCFCDWDPIEASKNRDIAVIAALSVFKHRPKIAAIAAVADRLTHQNDETVREYLLTDPVRWLESFPHVGPITKYHLARNLGVDVAKADRHLMRAADSFGYECVQKFCEDISQRSGDPVKIVDLVLWRNAELLSRAN
jgi:hypothetical protein